MEVKPLFRPGSGSRREKLKTNRKNAKNLEIIVLILKNLKKVRSAPCFCWAIFFYYRIPVLFLTKNVTEFLSWIRIRIKEAAKSESHWEKTAGSAKQECGSTALVIPATTAAFNATKQNRLVSNIGTGTTGSKVNLRWLKTPACPRSRSRRRGHLDSLRVWRPSLLSSVATLIAKSCIITTTMTGIIGRRGWARISPKSQKLYNTWKMINVNNQGIAISY